MAPSWRRRARLSSTATIGFRTRLMAGSTCSMLHLALAFERLSQGGEADRRAVGQAVFDRFCRDMDDHLREQGVSDLKVPKEMRRVGAAFFGRHGTYLTALRAGDRCGLAGGLAPQCLSGRSPTAAAARLCGLCEGGPCSAGWRRIRQRWPRAVLPGRIRSGDRPSDRDLRRGR